MNITLNGITQADFDYAFECIEECRQESAKEFGFNYPYFTPGGSYGEQWWQIDSSLALCGYKWKDRKFAEQSLWNFIESQKENGRICLWGADVLPETVAGGNVPMQRQEVSSLPKLFDVSYHTLQGTNDKKLKEATYNMMKKYVDWWFGYRFDKSTGLITAVFEETFIPYLGCNGEYAAVDTNVEVYVGCHYTELLATELGKEQDAKVLNDRKTKLKNSINTYLWDEDKGAYYPYSIKDRKRTDTLMASTFYPLRLCIANENQRKRLIALMKDNAQFNWESIPLTSVSMSDKLFTTTKGKYQGNESWSGNVWTLINEMVVRGLVDCQENDLAAELALKTVYAFNHNCAEFINPFDGSGHGVIKYAWTASQYVELIVETIFGVSYNASKEEVVIAPKLTDKLKNSYLALENIKLSADAVIDVYIDCGKISYSLSDKQMKVKVVNLNN